MPGAPRKTAPRRLSPSRLSLRWLQKKSMTTPSIYFRYSIPRIFRLFRSYSEESEPRSGEAIPARNR